MTGGAIFGIRSMLATSGRIDAPCAPPFAEQSAPNAVLPLKDGGPYGSEVQSQVGQQLSLLVRDASSPTVLGSNAVLD